MALEFRCAHVGVTDCKAATTADSKDELLAKVAAHARDTHGVELNDTLVNYALSTVTEK
jgi:predicted small metal-binding protein